MDLGRVSVEVIYDIPRAGLVSHTTEGYRGPSDVTAKPGQTLLVPLTDTDVAVRGETRVSPSEHLLTDRGSNQVVTDELAEDLFLKQALEISQILRAQGQTMEALRIESSVGAQYVDVYVLLALMSDYLDFLILVAAGWINRAQQKIIDYLLEENAVYRELLGGRPRLTDSQRRRLAIKAKALAAKIRAKIARIVTPDTLLRWFRRLVARKYDGSTKRGPGRPRLRDRIADLTVRMAQENLTWGYTRIRDALHNLGITTDRNTVKRVLNDRGIVPAPERRRHTPWKTFLDAHWDVLAAMDFFNVEVLTLAGIIRFHVLFVSRLRTREVEIVGITAQPCEAWMKQMARRLTDCYDGFLRDIRYVILDRDPLYTSCFRRMLKDSGAAPVILPRRSTNLNAHGSRFVSSIKSECLNKIIPLGERHLRKAIRSYVEHYHAERNHQGLESRIIHPPENLGECEGAIKATRRLGGYLNYYYREAA